MRNPLSWEPAIYEHKAALIGEPVARVARSSRRLASALVAERAAYCADFLTVGVDVYNIEAEACGAAVHDSAADACPEIRQPPWDLSSLPGTLVLPPVPQAGRFAMLLEAAAEARDMLDSACRLRIAAAGPVSIASRLVGLEPLVLALALEEQAAGRLLEFTTELNIAWCRAIRAAGFDAIVFDSAAAPPMLSPAMYRRCVAPLHRRVMGAMQASGQAQRPLVIGGDTTAIVADLVDAGANSIVCDFIADAAAFALALGGRDVVVRRNANPQHLGRADALALAARQLAADLRHFRHPVAGTGILPYHFDPALLQQFRVLLEEAT